MTCGIASRPGLRCLQDVIRAEGVVVAGESEQALSPREMLVASFERFLLVERGLAVGTVHGYVSHARRFLVRFCPDGEVGGVTASMVIGAVLAESATVGVAATQFFVAGLRSFLRFCIVDGLTVVKSFGGGAGVDWAAALVVASRDQLGGREGVAGQL